MRVNLKQLELLPGQSKTVTEELMGSDEWLTGVESKFRERLSLTLQAKYAGGGFQLKGMIQAPITMVCSRCLEPFDIVVTGDFYRFAMTEESQVRYKRDGLEDEDLLTVTDGIVDLSQAIEETLVLNLPMVPLCSDNCSGLCMVCGQNLNKGKCTCTNDYVDPRLEKLKELL